MVLFSRSFWLVLTGQFDWSWPVILTVLDRSNWPVSDKIRLCGLWIAMITWYPHMLLADAAKKQAPVLIVQMPDGQRSIIAIKQLLTADSQTVGYTFLCIAAVSPLYHMAQSLFFRFGLFYWIIRCSEWKKIKSALLRMFQLYSARNGFA